MIYLNGIAQNTPDDPYFFLYQTAKEEFLISSGKDTTEQQLYLNMINDLEFFESNQMWDAGFHYLSEFNMTDSEPSLPGTSPREGTGTLKRIT